MTLYDVMAQFIGVHEYPGDRHHPLVMAGLTMRTRNGRLLDFDGWPGSDEVAWCGGIMGLFAYTLGLEVPRLHLGARRWLTVGEPIELRDARMGNDIVILTRGDNAPAADVLDAPGHVACYGGHNDRFVIGLGGNQADAINRRMYRLVRVLGVRRLRRAKPGAVPRGGGRRRGGGVS